MSSKQPCELVLDADDVFTALDEGIEGLDPLAAVGHVARCASCQEHVRLRAKARHAWTTAMGHESPAAEPASTITDDNDNLRRAWEGTGKGKGKSPDQHEDFFGVNDGSVSLLRSVGVFLRSSPRGLIALAVTTPLCVVAIVIAIMHRSPDAPNVVSTNDTTAPRSANPSRPFEPQPRSLELPGPPPPSQPAKAPARSMVLPAGSHVTLGFAIGSLGGGGGAAADGSAELIGPASATASDTSLTLQRGTVKVNGLRQVTVLVPGAKLDPNGSTCTVQVDEHGVARVNVETGHALVTSRGGASVVTVEAGGSMELDPDGSLRVAAPQHSAEPTTPPPPPAISEEESVRRAALSATITPPPPPPPLPDTAAVLKEALGGNGNGTKTTSRPSAPTPLSSGATNPDEAISAARTRLRNGETSAARADLERLATSSDARVARRASFTLAEIDLAGGERTKARARLDDLVVCPEPALGADAATLLARSASSPVERAAVWKRYLTTNPPRPYHERALLDRAEALLDAGSTAEARAILDEVKQSPHLTDSQRRQLERVLLKAH